MQVGGGDFAVAEVTRFAEKRFAGCGVLEALERLPQARRLPVAEFGAGDGNQMRRAQFARKYPGFVPDVLGHLAQGRVGGQCSIDVADGDAQLLTLPVQAHALQIAREALSNALRHGAAKHVRIGLEREDGRLAFCAAVANGLPAVAAGLAPMALGSDGAGSIRIPSTWCGVFGIKPQRDRVPLAPHDDAWCGMSVNGPIARTVEDAALFLDVTASKPAPRGGFVKAAARKPGRLRIALSAKLPPTMIGRVGRPQQRALDGMEALLRDLGHEVLWRDPDYPAWAVYGHVLPRMWRGIYEDVQHLPHPERLEPRTRTAARLGSLVSDSQLAKIRAAEPTLAARVGSIFDDVDVLITPGTALGPSRVGQYQHRGGIGTLALVASRVPFNAIFNATGQPAAVVPWGLDAAGLPLSLQLVGRPSDEATLLSLSHQIEAARPWAGRRPPVS